MVEMIYKEINLSQDSRLVQSSDKLDRNTAAILHPRHPPRHNGTGPGGKGVLKGNVRNPPGRAPRIDMVRGVLTDRATGTRVRHRIRSLKQALRQQEWYEKRLGRRVRIEKVFDR